MAQAPAATGRTPAPSEAPDLWRAWDSLHLTEDGTRLVGWWDDTPVVRVVDDPSASVYASAYLRPGAGSGGVIAVASWSNDKSITVGLSVDWSAFGLSPSAATVTASPIANFQPALELDPSALSVAVPATKGWLLDVRAK